jgi:hypothetical protein
LFKTALNSSCENVTNFDFGDLMSCYFACRLSVIREAPVPGNSTVEVDNQATPQQQDEIPVQPVDL